MSRSDRIANGFLTSLVQYGIQMLVQAFLAPLVLAVAGREALGAYAAISQVVALLTLVDVAHSWSLERFLGQSLGIEDGGVRFRHVFTTARTLLLVSNAIFALLVILLSFFVGSLFHLHGTILRQGQFALYVIAAWSVVRTPLAAYGNAMIATQDLAASNLIGAFSGVARALFSLGFVFAGGGLFGLMTASTAADLLGSIFFRVRFTRMNPKLKPEWGIPDKALLKEMLGFGGHAMFLNVGNMLVFSSGSALATYVTGASVASGYYTTQQPGMSGFTMTTRLGENSSPAINELWGRNAHDQLRAALQRLLKFTLLLTMPLAAGLVLLNHDVITAWVGPVQYAGTLLTVSLAGFCLIASLQRIYILYAFAIGWVRLLTAASVLQGIGNCALAIYLGRHLGLGGITLALDIVLIPQTLILIGRVGRFFNLGPTEVLWPFLHSIKACLLPVGAGLVLRQYLHIQVKNKHTLLEAIGECVLFILLYSLSAYFWFLNAHERTMLVDRLTRSRKSAAALPEGSTATAELVDSMPADLPSTLAEEPAAQPLVSVLFVTYKRPQLLERALQSFVDHTDYPNLQLVVSDDGSPRDVQDLIRAMPFDTFVLPEGNRGLGANNNQGMAACRGKYILMIQDDRMCVGPRSYLSEAISVLESNPEVGLLNFQGHPHPGHPSAVLRNPGPYVPVALAGPEPGGRRVFLYTDMPHIITREAFDAVGPYIENRDMELCERDYELRWERQTRFLTILDGARHDSVFVNEGEEASFRHNRLRYRVARLLSGVTPRIKRASPALYVVLRACVRGPITLLEKLHIVR